MMRSFAAIAAILLPFAAMGQNPDDKFNDRIIYLPTPQPVVDKMLDLVKVTHEDVVFDLGCGDGRIVCTAAKKYNARGIGVDISAERIKKCAETMKDFEVTADQVEFRQGDALQVADLQRATVVALYMLPEFMEKIEGQLLKLKPGTRIVAHDYPLPNLTAEQMIDEKGADGRSHSIYVWTVKAPAK